LALASTTDWAVEANHYKAVAEHERDTGGDSDCIYSAVRDAEHGTQMRK